MEEIFIVWQGAENSDEIQFADAYCENPLCGGTQNEPKFLTPIPSPKVVEAVGTIFQHLDESRITQHNVGDVGINVSFVPSL